jgi:predicted metal-binding membrane protein
VHAHADPSAESLGALTVAWFAMMAAMMAPTAWPWIVAFDRVGARGRRAGRRALEAGLFGAGYLAAWLVYSTAAAALQRALDCSSPLAGALMLAVAGLFQFASLKHACLTHCRSPLGYFLTRWREGPTGGFRMGLHHGWFCVGCCWALMLTALAAGATSLWWMAGLALAAFAEQVSPWGGRLGPVLGVALVVAAAARLMAWA